MRGCEKTRKKEEGRAAPGGSRGAVLPPLSSWGESAQPLETGHLPGLGRASQVCVRP